VADQLDISQNAYSLIEKGATKITLDRLEELAALYKTTPISLITEGFSGIIPEQDNMHNNYPPALSIMEKKMYEQTITRLEGNIERLYEMIGKLATGMGTKQMSEQ